MDQDPGMTSRALGLWLEKENINIEITSSKNGIADIERCHRTINKKMRIIRTENKLETVAMDMKEIIYNYNHKTIHSASGKTPTSIFLFNEEPVIDVKQNKEDIIKRLNKDRKEHEIDTASAKLNMQLKRKLKIDNPFRKTKQISKLDDTHYKEYLNNRNIRRHRSKFK